MAADNLPEPDDRYTWLTEGLHAEFETFIPMGSKEAKANKGRGRSDVIFKTYSQRCQHKPRCVGL